MQYHQNKYRYTYQRRVNEDADNIAEKADGLLLQRLRVADVACDDVLEGKTVGLVFQLLRQLM
jgi:hypothetical protein